MILITFSDEDDKAMKKIKKDVKAVIELMGPNTPHFDQNFSLSEESVFPNTTTTQSIKVIIIILKIENNSLLDFEKIVQKPIYSCGVVLSYAVLFNIQVYFLIPTKRMKGKISFWYK